MILTVDVGNSNIVLTIFNGDNIVHRWRIITNKVNSSNEYELVIKQLMRIDNFDYDLIDGVVYSSVVPEINEAVLGSLKFLDKEILKVGDENVKIGVSYNSEWKGKVGQDILMNIVAGKKKFKENFIIIDMGTATTFDVAIKDGEYVGSIIAPGANLEARSIFDACSQLPEVEVKKPLKVMGNNTKELMQSGLYYGYLGTIKEIIKQIKEFYKDINFKIYITGGLAVVFVHDLKFIDGYFPDLTAEGLNEVWYLNKQ